MKKMNIKKILIVISCSIVLAILTIVGIFLLFNNDKITTNMQFEYLGLNECYENDSNKLTINEAGKVLTSLYAKVYDISEIVDTSDGLGLGWQNYAYEMGLISNEEYLNDITYIRLYELIYSYEKEFRNIKENEIKSLNIQIENLSEEQVNAINYLYTNEIISKDDLNNENLQDNVGKIKFEDIIIKCIFKFNLLDLNNDIIEYKSSLKISQNKNYFFVTDNVDSNILNKGLLKIENANEYLTPKQTYNKIRNDIDNITDLINGYFDVILNIDYNNISENKLYNQLNEYSLMDYFNIQNYVSFVKENKIKLEGKAKIIYPIMYYVDGYYYVRTMINYDVISSNTNENILFGNVSDNVKCLDVKINKDSSGWHISTIDMQTLKIK